MLTLKQEFESVVSKLNELSDDEIKQVVGGNYYDIFNFEQNNKQYENNVYFIDNMDEKKEEFKNNNLKYVEGTGSLYKYQ